MLMKSHDYVKSSGAVSILAMNGPPSGGVADGPPTGSPGSSGSSDSFGSPGSSGSSGGSSGVGGGGVRAVSATVVVAPGRHSIASSGHHGQYLTAHGRRAKGKKSQGNRSTHNELEKNR